MAPGQSEVGMLQVRVTSDNPGKIHYGNETLVTGFVTLRFLPRIRSYKVELKGPLVLDLVFEGSLKADFSSKFCPDTIKLFNQTANLHNGPFKADPDTDYQYPFAVTFPEAADPRETVSIALEREADGTLQYRRRITSVTVEDLPPSLSSKLMKNDSSLMGPDSGPTCRIDISYSLSARVQVPGIDVIVVNHSDGHAAVLYGLPKVPQDMDVNFDGESSLGMRIDFQDDSLLPEHARPRGFKGKTKALLAPTLPPKYCFNLRIFEVRNHHTTGYPVEFSIGIRGRPNPDSIVTAPEIRLDKCTAVLIAHTSFKDTATGSTSINHEIVATMRDLSVYPAGPFSHIHIDESYKMINTGLLRYVPSSFTHARVERSYTLRITVRLVVAEQYVSRTRDFKAEVHPPYGDGDEENAAAAFASMTVDEEVMGDEPPPTYEQVMAGPSVINDMPPSWEDAQNGTLLQSSVAGR